MRHQRVLFSQASRRQLPQPGLQLGRNDTNHQNRSYPKWVDLRGLAEPGCCNHLRHFESNPSLTAFQSAPGFFDIVEDNSELFPVSLD